MTHGELFAGCGGLALGLEQAGFELKWLAETDRFCATVLAQHFFVPNLGDVRLIDWSAVEPVDLLSGGFPCQDVSQAGLRAGLAGARSGLWFEFLRAIRALRPKYVLVENVTGLLTGGFGVVLAGLAEAGYDCQWCCLRSSDLGAPHRRERVFLVAHSDRGRREQRDSGLGELQLAATNGHSAADPDLAGRRGFPESAWFHGACRGFSVGRASDGRVEHTTEWGKYGDAIRNWELVFRAAPRPVDDRGRLNPAFVEWMLGFPDGWTAGVSKTQRLKMLGNSVQVQSGEVIGHAVRSLSYA